jgi:thiol-disulfide isomerase/thioredoxin
MSLPFDLRMFAAPAIVAVAALSAPAAAQEETLKVGSTAPAIVVQWLQGDVSDLSDSSKTYVVEFWATWCGPCMRSIPHLNEMHQKLKSKGLVIMGISDEAEGVVRPFLSKKGAAMSYPVGVDKDNQTKRNWMEAAKQNGIPCAFIVKDSKVAWIGNPLDPNFDKVVLGTMTGRYNPALTKKAEPILRAAKDAVRLKNFQDAYKHYDSLLEIDPKFFGDVAVLKYRTMLVDAKDPQGAAKWGGSMLAKAGELKDGVTLQELTETILNDSAIENRDYALALECATALDKNVRGASSKALVAEIYARQGDFAKASEAQYDAWMKADPAEKADFKRVLDGYKKSMAKAGVAKPASEAAGAKSGSCGSIAPRARARRRRWVPIPCRPPCRRSTNALERTERLPIRGAVRFPGSPRNRCWSRRRSSRPTSRGSAKSAAPPSRPAATSSMST